MTVLLDASYLLALVNERDVHHDAAKRIAVEIDKGEHGAPYLTDHLFDEIISVALRKWGKERAKEIGTFAVDTAQLLVTDEHLIAEAWKLFQKTKLLLSFTDCLNVVVCEAFGIDFIATFDKEFIKTNINNLK